MNADIEAEITGIGERIEFEGVTHRVVEARLGNQQEIKVLDENGDIAPDMVGKKVKMSLMCLAAEADSNVNEQFINPEMSDPYYCLVSGDIVEKGLREHEENVLNLVRLDIGQGTVLVKFDEPYGPWREAREGEPLRVLANKIILLEAQPS